MALTQTAVGRTFDFAFAVGGGPQLGLYPVDLAVGQDDTVYVLTKQSEQISNVHWTKTASQARVGMLTITSVVEEEEFVGEFGGYGDQPGKLIWPGCHRTGQQVKRIRHRRVDEPGFRVGQRGKIHRSLGQGRLRRRRAVQTVGDRSGPRRQRLGWGHL